MHPHFFNLAKHLELWDETIAIYRDSFPEWERENEAKILNNIKNSSYVMYAYQIDKEIVGFYILDISARYDYTLFSFLAIKESKRGLGLGSKLLVHSITYFQEHCNCSHLLIEAQERQAKLYARLGFNAIDLDYRVPSFNSSKSITMSLMLFGDKSLPKDTLSTIITDIFQRGYGLTSYDIRLKEQLQRVK